MEEVLVAAILGGIVGIAIDRYLLPAARSKLFCSCTDGYGMHDPETGLCHAVHLMVVKTYPNVEKELIPCRCRRYDGPFPTAK